MIKPKTFLLSLLLLPYLVWVVAAVFSLILIWPLIYTIGIPISFLTESIPILGKSFGLLYSFILAYVFGIVFWGLPYTLFVIGFFFWSKNKSTKKTYSSLLYSPLLLALIPVVGLMSLGLFSIASGKTLPLENWRNLGLISLLGVALCLIYGYIFVGLGMAGYKLFDFLKLLKSESEISQDISGLDIPPSDDNFKTETNGVE